MPSVCLYDSFSLSLSPPLTSLQQGSVSPSHCLLLCSIGATHLSDKWSLSPIESNIWSLSSLHTSLSKLSTDFVSNSDIGWYLYLQVSFFRRLFVLLKYWGFSITGILVMPMITASGPISEEDGVLLPLETWWRGEAESSSLLITEDGPERGTRRKPAVSEPMEIAAGFNSVKLSKKTPRSFSHIT